MPTYINRATRLHVDAPGCTDGTIANYYPRRLIMSLPRSLTPTDLRTSLRNNDLSPSLSLSWRPPRLGPKKRFSSIFSTGITLLPGFLESELYLAFYGLIDGRIAITPVTPHFPEGAATLWEASDQRDYTLMCHRDFISRDNS